jgi:hypothetical protein
MQLDIFSWILVKMYPDLKILAMSDPPPTGSEIGPKWEWEWRVFFDLIFGKVFF